MAHHVLSRFRLGVGVLLRAGALHDAVRQVVGLGLLVPARAGGLRLGVGQVVAPRLVQGAGRWQADILGERHQRNLGGDVVVAPRNDDVDEILGRGLQIHQLLPRHRARDVEHHGNLQVVADLARCLGELGRGRVDEGQLVDAGKLQERGLNVGRAGGGHRLAVVGHRELDRVVADRQARRHVLLVELLRRGDGAGRVSGARLQVAGARQHGRIDRGNGLVARVQPTADIDRGADGQHQHHRTKGKEDCHVAGAAGAETGQSLVEAAAAHEQRFHGTPHPAKTPQNT